jgi:membrane protein implicated in regulation of membrane protease activity
MQKVWKIFEYGYLLIAIVFIVETVLKWNTEREKAYLLLVFAVLAVVMYFFRRRFRNRMEKRNK